MFLCTSSNCVSCILRITDWRFLHQSLRYRSRSGGFGNFVDSTDIVLEDDVELEAGSSSIVTLVNEFEVKETLRED